MSECEIPEISQTRTPEFITCRTCLSTLPKRRSVAVTTTDKNVWETYEHIILAVTGIRVAPSDVICAVCKEKCVSAFQYKCQARKCDASITKACIDENSGINDHEDYIVKEFDIDVVKSEFPIEIVKNQCTICLKNFDSSVGLVRHIQSYHAVIVTNGIKEERQKSKITQPNKKESKTGSSDLRPCRIPILCTLEPLDQYKNDPRRERLRCRVCGEMFRTEAQLEIHCRGHSGTEVIMCGLCDRVYLKYVQFKRHFAVHHKTLEEIINAPNTETINELSGLTVMDSIMMHVRMTSIGDVMASNVAPLADNVEVETFVQVCGLCGLVILSPDELKAHNAKEHPDFHLRCYFCAKRFLHQRSAQQHMNRCKQSHLKVECVKCGCKATSDAALAKHVSTEHAQCVEYMSDEKSGLFRCDICNKEFTLKLNLRRHMKKHLDTNPSECQECKKMFVNKTCLSKHMKLKHTAASVLCQVCGRSLPGPYALTNHMRRHNTKAQECGLCDKVFATGHAYKYHMRGHSGDTPLVCRICHKGFIRPISLREHMMIHTGERPHECDVCGKRFRQKYGLVTHKKIHHRV